MLSPPARSELGLRLKEAFRRLRLAVQSARQDESSLYQVGLGEVARAANVFIPHFFKQTQLFFQHVFMWNSNLKKKNKQTDEHRASLVEGRSLGLQLHPHSLPVTRKQLPKEHDMKRCI